MRSRGAERVWGPQDCGDEGRGELDARELRARGAFAGRKLERKCVGDVGQEPLRRGQGQGAAREKRENGEARRVLVEDDGERAREGAVGGSVALRAEAVARGRVAGALAVVFGARIGARERRVVAGGVELRGGLAGGGEGRKEGAVGEVECGACEGGVRRGGVRVDVEGDADGGAAQGVEAEGEGVAGVVVGRGGDEGGDGDGLGGKGGVRGGREGEGEDGGAGVGDGHLGADGGQKRGGGAGAPGGHGVLVGAGVVDGADEEENK